MAAAFSTSSSAVNGRGARSSHQSQDRDPADETRVTFKWKDYRKRTSIGQDVDANDPGCSLIQGLGSSSPRTSLPGPGVSPQYGLALCMMAHDAAGASMCQARSALSSIAKRGAIAPPP